MQAETDFVPRTLVRVLKGSVQVARVVSFDKDNKPLFSGAHMDAVREGAVGYIPTADVQRLMTLKIVEPA